MVAIVLLAVLLALVVRVAVTRLGGQTDTRPLPPLPDHVHIVVTLIQPLPFEQVVFDQQFGAVASKVYTQLIAGERISAHDVMSCPSGSFTYYHYELDFSRAGVQTAVATSNAQGCAPIFLNYPGGEDEYFWRAANGVSFWQTLHQLTGAPLPINVAVD